MNNSFLPTGYEVPQSDSRYMRLEDGANKFRVLSSAIVGQEFWKTIDGKRKPVRRRPGERIEMNELEVSQFTGELEMPKHFWAFVVYNRTAEAIQILEITQKKIQQAMTALVKDEDWGDPKSYDITITKSGKKQETSYTVMPSPKKLLDPAITKLYEDMNINLEALFSGNDPYKSDENINIDDLPEGLLKA